MGQALSLSRFLAIFTPGSWVVGLKPAICEYWTAAAAAASIAACMSEAWGACCACWLIWRSVGMGVEMRKASDRSFRFGNSDLMVAMSADDRWLCC
jgi:hypothetical protein